MSFNSLYQFQLCTLILASQVRANFWLNQLDSYDSLPYCAEGPISSIVRDMVSECGDGGRTTSYSCFCTRSSSKFENIIATAVAKECSHWGTEASSATSIFHEYCQLGNGVLASTAVEDLPTVTSGLSSRTSRTSSTAQPEETEASTASTTPTSNDLHIGSKIAIGVSVPVGVISLCVVGFLYMRRRQRRRKVDGGDAGLEQKVTPNLYAKAEMDGNSKPVELPASEARLQPEENRDVYEAR
ncbi:Ff.00g024980.m01.CDS01 [Fusarium sp. VM40]|nr:Ff.00g024980.m01.CDS01 [Fusarium sp. VM40]